MQAATLSRRSEIRFPAQPGTIVEVNRHGVPDHATLHDISFGGILLQFDHSVNFAVGDWMTLDFARHSSDCSVPLPYWGVGRVVRVEGNEVALNFDIEPLVRLNWSGARDEHPATLEPADGEEG